MNSIGTGTVSVWYSDGPVCILPSLNSELDEVVLKTCNL